MSEPEYRVICDYIRIGELATALECSEQKIRSMVDDGELPEPISRERRPWAWHRDALRIHAVRKTLEADSHNVDMARRDATRRAK